MHLRTSLALLLCLTAFAQQSATPSPALETRAMAERAEKGDAIAQFLLGRMSCLGVSTAVDYVVAAKWFQKAAKQGNADAQCELGFLSQHGAGVSKSPSDAKKWYRLAAEQGHSEALYSLGRMYLRGEGVPRDRTQGYAHLLLAQACGDHLAEYFVYDLEQVLSADELGAGRQAAVKAMKQLRPLVASLPRAEPLEPLVDGYAKIAGARNLAEGAEKGDAESQYQMGRMYDRGEGLPQDEKKAMQWFLKAAEQGHAKAQKEVGDAYKFGPVSMWSYSEAVKWYRKAAEQGEVDAQISLGRTLAEGHDSPSDVMPRNVVDARKWFQKAEALGNARDLYWLGNNYEDVDGEAKDFAAAARCYRKAADQGYAEAQLKLGRAYELGLGVSKDGTEAAKWYLKAAENGNADAQYNLGMMYAEGEGVPRDSALSAKWFQAAAVPQKSDMPAEYTLQERLKDRRMRIAKDRLRAYTFFLVAQQCGNPEAQACIDELDKVFTKNEIAESRAKAELVWKRMQSN